MLVARRHLLDRVDVNIDVRGGVSGVKHLAEGQNEAACGVLGKAKPQFTNPQLLLVRVSASTAKSLTGLGLVHDAG